MICEPTKDLKWKKYSFKFLYLVILLGLFAAILPAHADDCTTIKIGEKVVGKPVLVSKTPVNSRNIGCYTVTKKSVSVKYCIWVVTYQLTWAQKDYGIYRQQCCCKVTGKCNWKGNSYQAALPDIITTTHVSSSMVLPEGAKP